jgi:hypothetical protein
VIDISNDIDALDGDADGVIGVVHSPKDVQTDVDSESVIVVVNGIDAIDVDTDVDIDSDGVNNLDKKIIPFFNVDRDDYIDNPIPESIPLSTTTPLSVIPESVSVMPVSVIPVSLISGSVTPISVSRTPVSVVSISSNNSVIQSIPIINKKSENIIKDAHNEEDDLIKNRTNFTEMPPTPLFYIVGKIHIYLYMLRGRFIYIYIYTCM